MQTLDEPGEGRVLVVDGQASKRCALLGDILAAKMHRNGFSVSGLSIVYRSEVVLNSICNLYCRRCIDPRRETW